MYTHILYMYIYIDINAWKENLKSFGGHNLHRIINPSMIYFSL